MDFIARIQCCFSIQKSINVLHHINRLKKKNHKIILVDAKKKYLTKIQHLLRRKGIKGNLVNLIKSIYIKPTANITLYSERLNAGPKDEEQGKDGHSHHSYSTRYWKLQPRQLARRGNKRHADQKGSNKTVFICIKHDYLCRKSKSIYQKNLLDSTSEFSKVTGDNI